MERRDFLKFSAAATLTLASEPTWAQTAKTEVHWLGQATTKITTSSGKVIVIDPFLTNNPKTPQDFKNLDKLGKVDVILITHGHADHLGTVGRTDGSSDAVDLAKRTGAKVFGPAGLIQTMIDLGGLFGDMRLIGEYYKPDVVLIPIGGHFVMDPRDAAYATKELLKPKHAVPIHYGTFPVLKGTPQEYQSFLGQTSTQVHPISPGDRLTF